MKEYITKRKKVVRIFQGLFSFHFVDDKSRNNSGVHKKCYSRRSSKLHLYNFVGSFLIHFTLKNVYRDNLFSITKVKAIL